MPDAHLSVKDQSLWRFGAEVKGRGGLAIWTKMAASSRNSAASTWAVGGNWISLQWTSARAGGEAAFVSQLEGTGAARQIPPDQSYGLNESRYWPRLQQPRGAEVWAFRWLCPVEPDCCTAQDTTKGSIAMQIQYILISGQALDNLPTMMLRTLNISFGLIFLAKPKSDDGWQKHFLWHRSRSGHDWRQLDTMLHRWSSVRNSPQNQEYRSTTKDEWWNPNQRTGHSGMAWPCRYRVHGAGKLHRHNLDLVMRMHQTKSSDMLMLSDLPSLQQGPIITSQTEDDIAWTLAYQMQWGCVGQPYICMFSVATWCRHGLSGEEGLIVPDFVLWLYSHWWGNLLQASHARAQYSPQSFMPHIGHGWLHVSMLCIWRSTNGCTARIHQGKCHHSTAQIGPWSP